MSFLDLPIRSPSGPQLYENEVWLRFAGVDDFREWTALRELSRAHLTKWEPAWVAEEMTAAAFRSRLKAKAAEIRRGTALPFLILRRSDNILVGGVTLSNIRLGASRSGLVGYWIGAPFVCKGYASSAVRAVRRYAFERLLLHRVEAACQPENTASRALLKRLGFCEEGLAREYLMINGGWRDHLLFASLASDKGAVQP